MDTTDDTLLNELMVIESLLSTPADQPSETKSDAEDIQNHSEDSNLGDEAPSYGEYHEYKTLGDGTSSDAEKMRRKGSFLTKTFSNQAEPMVDENNRATRLALSASAWGERVPGNADDAERLALKGYKLLEQCGSV